ncbi:hypothetical protein [Methanobacterium sp. MBAC-LM]|uniref:hypothetical protein n=1 Tax=Methanobacterium sp. MBAC-LM TaxID=3412034 RepID=UPI003C7938B4
MQKPMFLLYSKFLISMFAELRSATVKNRRFFTCPENRVFEGYKTGGLQKSLKILRILGQRNEAV